MIIGYYSAFPAILSPLMVNFATFYSLVSTSNGRRERGGGGNFMETTSRILYDRGWSFTERDEKRRKDGFACIDRVGESGHWFYCEQSRKIKDRRKKMRKVSRCRDTLTLRETSRRLFITAAKRLDVYLRGTAILSKLVSRFIVSAFLNNSR